MKVFVITNQDGIVKGITLTVERANRHIADLIDEGFTSVLQWDITEYKVVEN